MLEWVKPQKSTLFMPQGYENARADYRHTTGFQRACRQMENYLLFCMRLTAGLQPCQLYMNLLQKEKKIKICIITCLEKTVFPAARSVVVPDF